MKSITTTTTASELDTRSEGSTTSNKMLEWEVEGGEGGEEKGGVREREKEAVIKIKQVVISYLHLLKLVIGSVNWIFIMIIMDQILFFKLFLYT